MNRALCLILLAESLLVVSCSNSNSLNEGGINRGAFPVFHKCKDAFVEGYKKKEPYIRSRFLEFPDAIKYSGMVGVMVLDIYRD
jgi:hypothetical protein